MSLIYNSSRSYILNLIKHQFINWKRFTSTMSGDGYSLSKVVAELESFADPQLAEHWDNVGLLIEPSNHRVSKIMLTNDLTTPVMNEAVNSKVDMIISYHPPIFAPLKRITQKTWKERIITTCLENKIAVYSPHTAWDATPGAVGDSLASAFADYMASSGPIIPNPNFENMYDVIIEEDYKSLLTSHSGIKIVYSSNNDENVRSTQMIRILADKKAVLDIVNIPGVIMTETEQVKKLHDTKVGMGRLLQLKEPGCTLKQCISLMKCYTKLDHIRLAKGLNHNLDSLVKTVALVPGSGGSLLKGVCADLFVTGEMLHHDLLDATHRETSVILTNHSDSERPFLKQFLTFLQGKFVSMDIIISWADKDPIETV